MVPKRRRTKKHGDPRPSAGKALFLHEKGFHDVDRKEPARPRHWPHRPRCRRPPPPTTTAVTDAMADPGRRRPSRSMAEVLRTGRFPNGFVGDISARLRLSGSDCPAPTGPPSRTTSRREGGSMRFWAASRLRRPQSRGLRRSRSWGLTGTEDHKFRTRSSLSWSVPPNPNGG